MEIETAVREVQHVFAQIISEHRVSRLTQAWLTILRDAYHQDKAQFSEQQIEFLKEARALLIHLWRFIEIQEELGDAIGLDEYNQGLQELRLLDTELAHTAVSKRIKKEIRQLLERRPEVILYEQSRKNAKVTNLILNLEEKAGACPNGKSHRLQIRQGKNGYFWGCSAFPSCLHTQRLSRDELTQFERM